MCYELLSEANTLWALWLLEISDKRGQKTRQEVHTELPWSCLADKLQYFMAEWTTDFEIAKPTKPPSSPQNKKDKYFFPNEGNFFGNLYVKSLFKLWTLCKSQTWFYCESLAALIVIRLLVSVSPKWKYNQINLSFSNWVTETKMLWHHFVNPSCSTETSQLKNKALSWCGY